MVRVKPYFFFSLPPSCCTVYTQTYEFHELVLASGVVSQELSR